MVRSAPTLADRRGEESRIRLPDPLPASVAFRGIARWVDETPIGRDLIDVGIAVLLADRLVRRPRSGRRLFRLDLAVRTPQRWREVEPMLREALSVLTDDLFSFQFRRTAWRTQGVIDAAGPLLIDRITLFSGGLDSACAAASFARAGQVSAYVTQYTIALRRLRSLLRDIQGRYAEASEAQHGGFYFRPAGPVVARLRENSRRSRSFLFVGLALATAAGIGAGEVCVCENGPLALNLPLSPAMTPTRHAHSQFLKAMQRLGTALFETPIRVTNPFELKTKGEMTRIFRNQPELALASVSCWNQQWAGRGARHGSGHCGLCVPCLVRRTALDAGGITVPRDHFDTDVRTLAARRFMSSVDRRRLGYYRALLSFASRIENCGSWRSFLRAFPEALDSEPTYSSLKPEAWYRALFAMMRRFSGEVHGAFGKLGA